MSKPTLTATYNSTAHEFLHAAFTGDLANVQRLLGEGMDINTKDGAGWTALMCAASKANSPEVTAYLIARGADATILCNDGRTALDWAVTYKKTESADVLRRDPEEIKAEYNARLAASATTLEQTVMVRKPFRLK